MSRLGPEYRTWISKLQDICNSTSLAEVTTEVNPIANPSTGNYDTQISVIDKDTISAAIEEHKLNSDSKICILNFASYKHPGGGFMSGSLAQEEAICHCTNLYPALAKQQAWYDRHTATLNRGAYTDECLVSHDITVLASKPGNFLPESERFNIDVLTCAAPNWTSVIRYNPCDQALFDMMYKAAFNRVLYLMQVFAGYDYDTIILGAFGCGVFKNDPEAIAEAFYYALTELLPGAFKRVIFAVPDSSSRNYRAFYDQFGGSTSNLRTGVFK